jgi:hypothetical protein
MNKKSKHFNKKIDKKREFFYMFFENWVPENSFWHPILLANENSSKCEEFRGLKLEEHHYISFMQLGYI